MPSTCPQLVIYLVLTSMSIISSYLVTNEYMKVSDKESYIGSNVTANLIGHMIGMIIMSILLYWLCKHNYNTVAWLILVFPIIFVFMILILFITAISTNSTNSTNSYDRPRRHHRHHRHQRHHGRNPPHGHWR